MATGRGPILISGPCSAETEEQVLETARRLANTGKVDYIRAGIWKPRTRPGSFEGVGVTGLPWMQKVKEETGLPVTVEVAKATHVEQCLEHGIDMLWIGARTCVNPFAVQEIADALRGVDIPVLLKNPMNPDLSLWLGGIERLSQSGLKRIGAIHRGFSNYGEKVYRNKPQWPLAIAFQKEMPEIPLLCDPSHICGNRELLLDVSQKALDLDFDGLMLESHIDPDNAWTDAKQQVTPEDLITEIIDKIAVRFSKEGDPEAQSQLNLLRQQIDSIDDELYALLSNRMHVVREIGSYKKGHEITILQMNRWNEIIERGFDSTTRLELSKEFMHKYLQIIHEESIDQQVRVMNLGEQP